MHMDISGIYCFQAERHGVCLLPKAIKKQCDEREHMLLFSGSLFNMTEEALLDGLIEKGCDFVKELNGVFAFCYWDESSLMLARDHMGVKPLYYAVEQDRIIFGSKPGGLFELGVKPAVDQQGLRELFALGPAHTPGSCVYSGVQELLPGEFLLASPDGITKTTYWRLESRPHTDSFEDTVETVAQLVKNSVERQMETNAPLCAFLSGGLDSSIVTAIGAKKLARQGKRLRTFSFDFDGNDEFYQSHAFQPSRDAPYALEMAEYLDTEHVQLTCSHTQLADLLDDAMEARDMPGMADIDASLLYFCGIAGKTHKVALTGECADEVFGGYPWFRSEEALDCRTPLGTFPWSRDHAARRTLLRDDVLDELQLEEYAGAACEASVAETPRLPGENPREARRREIAWLNLRWFMQTLLARMDCCAGAAGMEARVPFADIRLLEYVWNIPWEMKYQEGHAKYLLRAAGQNRLSGQNLLPDSVLWRKKSPYPKTYHPQYAAILAERLRDILNDPNQPLHRFVDKRKAEEFLKQPPEHGAPWYGQLMAAPQRVAWFLQINAWMRKYRL